MRSSVRMSVAMAALALAANLTAQTAPPDLEELQRQFANAKAQEARSAEAARREAAARAAQEARMATLMIRADADCKLRIDGESMGRLLSGDPHTVELIGGKQLIECVSGEEPSSWRSVWLLAAWPRAACNPLHRTCLVCEAASLNML